MNATTTIPAASRLPWRHVAVLATMSAALGAVAFTTLAEAGNAFMAPLCSADAPGGKHVPLPAAKAERPLRRAT